MVSFSVISVPQWQKKIYSANGLRHYIHFESVLLHLIQSSASTLM